MSDSNSPSLVDTLTHAHDAAASPSVAGLPASLYDTVSVSVYTPPPPSSSSSSTCFPTSASTAAAATTTTTSTVGAATPPPQLVALPPHLPAPPRPQHLHVPPPPPVIVHLTSPGLSRPATSLFALLRDHTGLPAARLRALADLGAVHVRLGHPRPRVSPRPVRVPSAAALLHGAFVANCGAATVGRVRDASGGGKRGSGDCAGAAATQGEDGSIGSGRSSCSSGAGSNSRAESSGTPIPSSGPSYRAQTFALDRGNCNNYDNSNNNGNVGDCINAHLQYNIPRELPIRTPVYARIHAVPRRHAPLTTFAVLRDEPRLVAVCKPAGLPSVATTDNARENAVRLASDAAGRPLAVTTRLDAPTSGVLLLVPVLPNAGPSGRHSSGRDEGGYDAPLKHVRQRERERKQRQKELHRRTEKEEEEEEEAGREKDELRKPDSTTTASGTSVGTATAVDRTDRDGDTITAGGIIMAEKNAQRAEVGRTEKSNRNDNVDDTVGARPRWRRIAQSSRVHAALAKAQKRYLVWTHDEPPPAGTTLRHWLNATAPRGRGESAARIVAPWHGGVPPSPRIRSKGENERAYSDGCKYTCKKDTCLTTASTTAETATTTTTTTTTNTTSTTTTTSTSTTATTCPTDTLRPLTTSMTTTFVDGTLAGPRWKKDKDDKWVHAELDVELVRRVGSVWQSVVRLRTGRTHQIRLQFAAVGCALVGDTKYAAAGQALLAWTQEDNADHDSASGEAIGGAGTDARLGADSLVIGLHAVRVDLTLDGEHVSVVAPPTLRGDFGVPGLDLEAAAVDVEALDEIVAAAM